MTNETFEEIPEISSGYVIFDINIFINLITEISKCNSCGSSIIVTHQINEKKGFCRYLFAKFNKEHRLTY